MTNERQSACDLAIHRTLSYRAVFRYPLSFYQLGTFLIAESPHSYAELKESLDTLKGIGLVKSKKGRLFLKNTSPVNWEIREKESNRILEEHAETFRILSKIPWIRLLAVTGATAALNFRRGDDLDIFIVTQRNRLWITRFFVVLLLKSMGRYRTDKDPSDKICPNLFVSESNLAWDTEKRDIYVAHEIAMMHPVINRGDMYFRFIKANTWISDHLANVTFSLPDHFKPYHHRKSKLLDMIEAFMMLFQVSYMKKRRTVEKTSRGVIHFNKMDSSERILSRYQKIYKKTSKII